MSGTYVIRAGLIQKNTGPQLAWTDNSGVQTNIVSDSWDTDVGGTAGHHVYANLFSAPDAPGQYILRYYGDSTAIYVDGTPTSFAGLTAGFTPTSTRIEATIASNADPAPYIDNIHNGRSVYLSFDPFSESGDLAGTNSSPISGTYNYPGSNIPSILNLLNNGFGVRAKCGLGSWVSIVALEITGSYSIVSYTWYYNPNTNHFAYLASNPGAPWIPQIPTPTVTSVTPNQGPTSFPPPWNTSLTQEVVTITGTGFGNGAGFSLDGVPLSQVNVANQTTATGVVGNFAGTVSGPTVVIVDGEDPSNTGRSLDANTSVGSTTVTNPDAGTASLASSWTYYNAIKTWWQTVALPFLFFSYYTPTLTFPFGFFFNSIWYPPNVLFVWTATGAPSAPGWWLSINNDFNGAAFVIAQSTPHNPRSFDEISSFATGSSGMQGGFPGPSCVWNNRLVYAEGGYTVGTNQPPIDIYDGAFNHTIALVPTTSTGGIPTAVMTMLSANGTVYFSTLDSGTSSANYSGRVFSLNINTGQMAQLGVSTDFATGDVPYTLVWFLGKLWCGTNRGDGTAGHIYWIRPGIDTNWTLDYSLSSSSVGGATSIDVYNGNLYVGTSGGSGTFAQVLKRDTLGNWTTSDTASGGTAHVNNAYLAMTVYNGNLYATYWNNDTPVKSLIRQFNGTTWVTVYTGSGDTNIPLIALPTDQNNLLAVGGGLTYAGAVVNSTNGTSWTDNTVFLTQSGTNTALPVFGVIVR